MIANNPSTPLALGRTGARARGFSLVEMALVLLIVGLLAAVFLPATNTFLENNRRKETRAKLEALEQAVKGINRELNVFEASCFSGCYITGDINEAYLDAIEAARKKGKAASEQKEEDNSNQMVDLNLNVAEQNLI